MSNMKAGRVIAIDGPDGVGKTTQVRLLADYYRGKGINVHVTRSSGGTPIGEALRKVSLSDTPRPPLTDFYISRAMGAALTEDIGIRKTKGEVIIIDRSPLAWVAYNAYGSQMLNKAAVLHACSEELQNWQIDMLIMLTADSKALQERRSKRAVRDFFEKQNQTYHRRVQQGYTYALEQLRRKSAAHLTIVNINASDTIESVHKHIVSAL